MSNTVNQITANFTVNQIKQGCHIHDLRLNRSSAHLDVRETFSSQYEPEIWENVTDVIVHNTLTMKYEGADAPQENSLEETSLSPAWLCLAERPNTPPYQPAS